MSPQLQRMQRPAWTDMEWAHLSGKLLQTADCRLQGRTKTKTRPLDHFTTRLTAIVSRCKLASCHCGESAPHGPGWFNGPSARSWGQPAGRVRRQYQGTFVSLGQHKQESFVPSPQLPEEEKEIGKKATRCKTVSSLRRRCDPSAGLLMTKCETSKFGVRSAYIGAACASREGDESGQQIINLRRTEVV
jgi:hypothetical protein